jgi:hypothetical protein
VGIAAIVGGMAYVARDASGGRRRDAESAGRR